MISKVSDSYKHHPLAFIIGPFLKMIEAIFDLLIPLVMKSVIDLSSYGSASSIPNIFSRKLAEFILMFGVWVPGEENFALNNALIGGVLILLMGIVGFISTMVTQYIAARTAVLVGKEVRQSLYEKSLSLSRIEKERIGENRLLTILNADSYQVQTGVLIYIRLIVRAPFIILGALAFSFILDIKTGFIFLAIIPLILLIVFFIMNKSSKQYVKIQSQLDHLSTKTSDTINGSKVIRAFNSSDSENVAYEKLTSSYEQKAIRVNRLNALINPLTFAIVSIATLVVVLLGFRSATTESVSTIITEIAYLAQIFVTLVQLTNVILILTKAKVSSKRCDEVLSIKPSVTYDESSVTKEINNGEEILSFENVCLSYVNGGNNALDNISFKLNKGQSLGIIGGTGSGKSTVISLIERFFDSTSGIVRYKGENIKHYSLKSLRSEIGLASQKSVLFKGTIKSNLLMANKLASDEDIIDALKDSEAYEFVSKYEDNINHIVNEDGSNYSGGQRQRLSIARALISHPEIIILDDSLSALDLLTDKKVRDNISKKYKGITKIIVSQRVATIKDCDLILVLSGGKLLMSGNHDSLMKSCPTYKEIFETQIRKENE